MYTPCFAAAVAVKPSRPQLASSFTPRRPRDGLRSVHLAPTMLLGIPRLFGGSGRPKQALVTETVQVPPPVIKPDGPVAWVKAHPLQVALFASLLINSGKAFIGWNKNRTAQNLKTASVSNDSKRKSTSTSIRAVPKKHETREEALDLLSNTARKYIIVGGKGGVGKTSMSAAVATSFADIGQTTLIISTDPAHSLSDAFGQDFAGGEPVPVLGIDNLYAQEIDPDSVKRTFKMMNNMDGMKGMGMEDMGLDDLNSLFETIPPGFDEAVALVEIVKYIQGDAEYTRFERIVFDTAPTGHTLRLLALPDFLNGFFGKIISMKSKLGGVMNQFKGMFGASDADLNDSVGEMEELKKSMNMVRELFRDEVQTEFVVATIPNMMSIAESMRLVQELRKEKIPVRHMFVNMVQPSNDDCTFCATRHKEQSSNMRYLEQEFEGLQIATVQSFDKEIKGVAALRAMGAQLFPDDGKRIDSDAVSGNGTMGRAKAELVE